MEFLQKNKKTKKQKNKNFILGDYTMIAGKLLHTTSSDHIIVYPYRIQSFKSSSKHELNWPLEVIDISQHVYHSI